MQIHNGSYSKELISLLPFVNGQIGMIPLFGFAVCKTYISMLIAYAHMRARIPLRTRTQNTHACTHTCAHVQFLFASSQFPYCPHTIVSS